MEDAYQIILATSVYIIFFGLVSRFVREKLYLPDSTLSTLYGVIIGPTGLNMLDIDRYKSENTLFGFARIVISLQIMTIALQLPNRYVYKKRKSLLALLFVVSLVSCLVTFAILAVFSSFGLHSAWSIAAACTPTDPILSSSIMHGKFADENVPERIRLLLATESSLNDGIGILLLYALVDLVLKPPQEGIKAFLQKTLLLKTIFPIFAGYFAGSVLVYLLKLCHTKRLVGNSSMTIFGIALSLACMCMAISLGQSEFIFIFFTGNVFSYTEWFVLETRGSQFQTIIESIFNISFFIFLGSRINWSLFDIQTAALCILIIAFRRPLVVLLLYRFIPEIRDRREALMVGWFGPIGVGALYYSILADKIMGSFTIVFVSFLVMSSLVLHGFTVPMYVLYSFIVKKTSEIDDEIMRRPSLTVVHNEKI